MRSKKSGFKYVITAHAEWKLSSVGLRDRKSKDHTTALLPMLLVDIVTKERRWEVQEVRGMNSVATLTCKDKPLDGFHKNRT